MNLLKVIGIILLILLVLVFLLGTDVSTPESKLGEHQIIIKNNKFTPDYLEINEGDTVVFICKEADHTVNFGRKYPNYSHRKILKIGEEHKVKFEEKGEYPYYCDFHVLLEGMQGTIIVE